MRSLKDPYRWDVLPRQPARAGPAVPEVTIPVAPGRNMAILVETAVRNHMLKLKGYDASTASSRPSARRSSATSATRTDQIVSAPRRHTLTYTWAITTPSLPGWNDPCVRQRAESRVAMKFVIVTGLSGSARALRSNTLEDSAFYCSTTCRASCSRASQTPSSTDTPRASRNRCGNRRTQRPRRPAPRPAGGRTAARGRRRRGDGFLEADDEVLVQRFSETAVAIR